jgi:hypothetical protein
MCTNPELAIIFFLGSASGDMASWTNCSMSICPTKVSVIFITAEPNFDGTGLPLYLYFMLIGTSSSFNLLVLVPLEVPSVRVVSSDEDIDQLIYSIRIQVKRGYLDIKFKVENTYSIPPNKDNHASITKSPTFGLQAKKHTKVLETGIGLEKENYKKSGSGQE